MCIFKHSSISGEADLSSHVQITFHQLCCEVKDIFRIRDGAIRNCYIKSWRQIGSMDRIDTYQRGSSLYIDPAHTRCGLEKGKNVSNVSKASEVTDREIGLSWPKRKQMIHAMDSQIGKSAHVLYSAVYRLVIITSRKSRQVARFGEDERPICARRKRRAQ